MGDLPLTNHQSALRDAICQSSVSKQWDSAKTEWEVAYIFRKRNGECLCGKDITEHCVIRNKINRAEKIVGNECMKHFGGELRGIAKEAFSALRTILRGGFPQQKTANFLVNMAFIARVIDEKTKEKYMSIRECHRLTDKQRDAIHRIHDKIKHGFWVP
jgi:hypothetical protein